ncbi:MAG: NAD(P)-binding protein, partial [Deltaproteobacteria bacterium]|nr:NAD(P)-binding protein [Deltaproteobacteria bacterium]
MSEFTENPILVLGGGAAGLAASAELAKLGVKSLLVEQTDRLGGLALRLACKATETCARCGVCLVDDLLAEVAESPLIETALGCRLEKLSRSDGGFTASINGDQTQDRAVAGLVAAVGARPIEGSVKPQFGYDVFDDVISGLELEEMVRFKQEVARPSDGKRPQRVAFIQCVGSRDLSCGQSSCSRICCAYTARLARWIMRHQPGTEITIFFIDLQTVGRDPEGLLAELEGRVDFVRSIP